MSHAPPARPPGFLRGDPERFITRKQVLDIRAISTILSFTNTLDASTIEELDNKTFRVAGRIQKAWFHMLHPFATVCLRKHGAISCIRDRNRNLTLIYNDEDVKANAVHESDKLAIPPELHAAFCSTPDGIRADIFGCIRAAHSWDLGACRFYLTKAKTFDFNQHATTIAIMLKYIWHGGSRERAQGRFDVLKVYVYLACAHKMTARFTERSIYEHSNIPFYLNLRPSDMPSIFGADAKPFYIHENTLLFKNQIELINKILEQHFQESPDGKAPVCKELDLKNGQIDEFTTIHSSEFQTILAICYSSARRSQTELTTLIDEVKQTLMKLEKEIDQAKIEDSPHLTTMMDEHSRRVTVESARLLEAQENTEFWNRAWNMFQQCFKTLLEGHLECIGFALDVDTPKPGVETVQEDDVETLGLFFTSSNDPEWYKRALAHINFTSQYMRALDVFYLRSDHKENEYKSLQGYFRDIKLRVLDIRSAATDQITTPLRVTIKEFAALYAADEATAEKLLIEQVDKEAHATGAFNIDLDSDLSFGGSCHREYIHVTLHLLARLSKSELAINLVDRNTDFVPLPSIQVLSRFARIDDLMVTTKLCCPGCALLISNQVAHTPSGLNLELISPGHHTTWSPLSLPPWMLRSDADQYETDIRIVLKGRLDKLVDAYKKNHDPKFNNSDSDQSQGREGDKRKFIDEKAGLDRVSYKKPKLNTYKEEALAYLDDFEAESS